LILAKSYKTIWSLFKCLTPITWQNQVFYEWAPSFQVNKSLLSFINLFHTPLYGLLPQIIKGHWMKSDFQPFFLFFSFHRFVIIDPYTSEIEKEIFWRNQKAAISFLSIFPVWISILRCWKSYLKLCMLLFYRFSFKWKCLWSSSWKLITEF